MSELSDFIKDKLYPALYPEIDKVFPEMEFKKVGKKWISSHYLNGSPTKGNNYRPDKTFIKESRINRAKEQGGDNIDLISLYMGFNGLNPDDNSQVAEAAKAICKIINLEFPEKEGDWVEAKRRQEVIEQSYERQVKALFSPEGETVLRYLTKERGYSLEIIRKMGLGYMSQKEGNFLEESIKIGYFKNFEAFPLSIPYYSKGRLRGFKLRSIIPGQKDKYRNTGNLNGLIKQNPFFLAPWNVKGGTDAERTLIVVEGELDCLHAVAEGGENIIATAGSDGVTPEMATAIKEKGYTSVILTLDTDGAGQDMTEKNIITLAKEGITVYVAKLPEAKDTDEYLNKHTIEDFKQVLFNCVEAVYFLFWREVDRYEKTSKSRIEFDKFVNTVIKLTLRVKSEILRGRILDALKAAYGVSGEEAYKGFRETAD